MGTFPGRLDRQNKPEPRGRGLFLLQRVSLGVVAVANGGVQVLDERVDIDAVGGGALLQVLKRAAAQPTHISPWLRNTLTVCG